MLFDNFIFTIEIIGTIAFAVSGALSGVSKRLDILRDKRHLDATYSRHLNLTDFEN